MRNQSEFDWNSLIRLGPKLSLIVGSILIVQTILNDPSIYIKDEIALQLQMNVPTQASNNNGNHQASGQGGFVPSSDLSNDRRFLAVGQNESKNGVLGAQHLYRPSFWPHAEIKEDSVESGTDGDATSKGPAIQRFPGQSAVLTNYKESVLVPLTDFMVLDEDKVVVPVVNVPSSGQGYATCRFMDYQYSFFFPHLAQQLFRCWSFWRANEHKTPIFVTSGEYHWKLAMDKEFNRGIIGAIQQAGVHVLNASSVASLPIASENEQSVSALARGPILQANGDHYQVTSIEDMISLRDSVLSSLNLSHVIPSSFCHHSSNFPRIGILSRLHSRRIKNVKDVAQQLKMHYNLTYNIPVIYFESAPFLNQVGMMASIDILITPHGAQETGAAFMPRCGGVLELLPDKYFFPRFYGTLAATRGLEHAYIYLAKNASDSTVDSLQRDVGFLQPSKERIQEGVTLLVERWRRCCDEMVHREQETMNFLSSMEGALDS